MQHGGHRKTKFNIWEAINNVASEAQLALIASDIVPGEKSRNERSPL